MNGLQAVFAPSVNIPKVTGTDYSSLVSGWNKLLGDVDDRVRKNELHPLEMAFRKARNDTLNYDLEQNKLRDATWLSRFGNQYRFDTSKQAYDMNAENLRGASLANDWMKYSTDETIKANNRFENTYGSSPAYTSLVKGFNGDTEAFKSLFNTNNVNVDSSWTEDFKKIYPQLKEAFQAHNISDEDAYNILGIMARESGFIPTAKSAHSSAYGLGQMIQSNVEAYAKAMEQAGKGKAEDIIKAYYSGDIGTQVGGYSWLMNQGGNDFTPGAKYEDWGMKTGFGRGNYNKIMNALPGTPMDKILPEWTKNSTNNNVIYDKSKGRYLTNTEFKAKHDSEQNARVKIIKDIVNSISGENISTKEANNLLDQLEVKDKDGKSVADVSWVDRLLTPVSENKDSLNVYDLAKENVTSNPNLLKKAFALPDKDTNTYSLDNFDIMPDDANLIIYDKALGSLSYMSKSEFDKLPQEVKPRLQSYTIASVPKDANVENTPMFRESKVSSIPRLSVDNNGTSSLIPEQSLLINGNEIGGTITQNTQKLRTTFEHNYITNLDNLLTNKDPANPKAFENSFRDEKIANEYKAIHNSNISPEEKMKKKQELVKEDSFLRWQEESIQQGFNLLMAGVNTGKGSNYDKFKEAINSNENSSQALLYAVSMYMMRPEFEGMLDAKSKDELLGLLADGIKNGTMNIEKFLANSDGIVNKMESKAKEAFTTIMDIAKIVEQEMGSSSVYGGNNGVAIHLDKVEVKNGNAVSSPNYDIRSINGLNMKQFDNVSEKIKNMEESKDLDEASFRVYSRLLGGNDGVAGLSYELENKPLRLDKLIQKKAENFTSGQIFNDMINYGIENLTDSSLRFKSYFAPIDDMRYQTPLDTETIKRFEPVAEKIKKEIPNYTPFNGSFNSQKIARKEWATMPNHLKQLFNNDVVDYYLFKISFN